MQQLRPTYAINPICPRCSRPTGLRAHGAPEAMRFCSGRRPAAVRACTVFPCMAVITHHAVRYTCLPLEPAGPECGTQRLVAHQNATSTPLSIVYQLLSRLFTSLLCARQAT